MQKNQTSGEKVDEIPMRTTHNGLAVVVKPTDRFGYQVCAQQMFHCADVCVTCVSRSEKVTLKSWTHENRTQATD